MSVRTIGVDRLFECPPVYYQGTLVTAPREHKVSRWASRSEMLCYWCDSTLHWDDTTVRLYTEVPHVIAEDPC